MSINTFLTVGRRHLQQKLHLLGRVVAENHHPGAVYALRLRVSWLEMRLHLLLRLLILLSRRSLRAIEVLQGVLSPAAIEALAQADLRYRHHPPDVHGRLMWRETRAD